MKLFQPNMTQPSMSPPEVDPRLLEQVRAGIDATLEHDQDQDADELSASDFELQAQLTRVLAQKRSGREVSASDTAPFPEITIGRFQLRGMLGHGGFGAVFRAHDPEKKRDVALKVLRPDAMLSKPVRERFVEEARTSSLLDHPGIVVTYEVGVYRSVPFIASYLCEGPTLDEWLDGHEAHERPHDVARFIASLAEAVHYAHSRGVLHRDIKPSNILLRPDEEAAVGFPFHPLLTDFGLAKRVDSEALMTHTGTTLGTPAYMPPEQAVGSWNEVGVASDVFSLGVILYEMLTGERPFSGDNAEQIKSRILFHEPVSPRAIRASIPAALSLITLKCLEKEPSKRYDSAKTLAEDLHNFLEHRPLRARPSGTISRLILWCRRSPALAALSFAFLIFVIASFIGINQARKAEAEMRKVTRKAMRNVYTHLATDKLFNEPGMQKVRLQLLEYPVQVYRDVVAQYPKDEISRHDLSVSLHEFANVLSSASRHNDAVVARQECLAIARELVHEFPRNRTYRYDCFYNLMTLAGELSSIDRDEKGQIAIKEAEKFLAELLQEAPDNEVYQDARAALCNLIAQRREQQKDIDGAIAAWHEAIDRSLQLEKAHPERPLYAKHAIEALSALGIVMADRQNFALAKEYAEEATMRVRQVQAQAPNERWTDQLAESVHTNYANWLMKWSRHREAITPLQECIKAVDRLIAWNPETLRYRTCRAGAWFKLGQVYYETGDHEHSREAHRKSLEDWQHAINVLPNPKEARRMYDLVRSSAERLEKESSTLSASGQTRIAAPIPAEHLPAAPTTAQ